MDWNIFKRKRVETNDEDELEELWMSPFQLFQLPEDPETVYRSIFEEIDLDAFFPLFSSLAIDIQAHTLSFLSFQEILSARSVSKDLCALVDSQILRLKLRQNWGNISKSNRTSNKRKWELREITEPNDG
eukprot:TRINITY_DN23434_c0_g1_i1.p1 TRINITY_DN23434_c0_g1~~TRINITY_DN23434_c0_g1_i1.p1  ORF type:complete len:149 (-),score=15.83 TRINITY_DN23434_c0_g1_i1:78-467(-)